MEPAASPCPTPPPAANEPLLTRHQVRLLGYCLVLIVLGWLLYRCRTVLPLFLLGFLLAYLFDPLLDRLQARGWTRSQATFLVFGVLTLMLALAALVLIPVLTAQVWSLAVNFDVYTAKFSSVVEWTQHVAQRFDSSGETVEAVRAAWAKLGEQALKQAPRAATWLRDSLSGLVLLLILPIITYYFMQEIDPLRARIRHLLPQQYAPQIIEMSAEINQLLGRYLRGQATVCLLLGITSTVVLLIFAAVFKMGYALLLGVVAGITYFIPFLGATATALAAGVVGYVTTDSSWLCAVLVVVSMAGVNQLFDSLITPRIVGDSVGLHPLTVLFALMVGGTLAGIPGMILAVPGAASLKVLLVRLFPRLEDELPSPAPAAPPPVEAEVETDESAEAGPVDFHTPADPCDSN